MEFTPFTKLKIWQTAHRLSLRIYGITRAFPSDEKFGLTSQLRRASVSVSANIAEGTGRGSSKELSYFLHVAHGSIKEMVSHCLLARDLSFIDPKEADELIREYGGLSAGISAFMKKM